MTAAGKRIIKDSFMTPRIYLFSVMGFLIMDEISFSLRISMGNPLMYYHSLTDKIEEVQL
jgi:hypothetical protein